MAKEHGYSLIIDGDRAEASFCDVFNNEHILYWAYIFQDKEVYNEYDLDVLRYGARRTWAEGFPGKEKYSSLEEFIEDRMKTYPQIGDKRESIWRVLIITDKTFLSADIAKMFDAKDAYVRSHSYKMDISNEIETLVGENALSVSMGRHHYSDDEVKANFDFRNYITEAKKVEKLELIKSNFDPAMIFSLSMVAFIIAAAVKFGTRNTSSWLPAFIIGGIGLLYLILNFGAIEAGKKQDRFVSGIPFIGGIHLLIAGLVSPVKWLALLFLLDFTIWNFISEFIKSKS